MASNPEVGITVSLIDEASKSLANLGGKVEGFGSTLKNAFSFAAGGLLEKGIEGLAGGLGDLFSSAIGDARETAGVMAQTQAAITATGGAAGFSAQQIQDMSGALSDAAGKSLFSGEQVQQGANLLLTFKGIKDQLPAATSTLVDMATAMGTDVKGAAIQLGKALNSPADGLTALTRVGVTFTDQQKQQIQAMQAAGDISGAQGIILQELSSEFGGSGEAAAKAAGGWHQFQAQLSDTVKGIAGTALPAIDKLGSLLAGPEVQGAIQSLATSLTNGLGGAIDWLSTTGIPAAQGFITGLTSAFQSGGIGGATSYVLDQLQTLGASIISWITEQAPTWGPALLQMGQAFINWVGPMIPPLLSELASLAATIGGWIVEQAPAFINQLLAWGQAFIGWIEPYIPQILASLSTLVTNVWAWIVEQAPGFINQLLAWGQAFLNWVAPYIPQILATLGGLVSSIWGWIVEQAPGFIAQLAAWGQALLPWVAPYIPQILSTLGNLISSVWGWIVEQAPGFAQQLLTWGNQLVTWIAPMIPPALAALGQLASSFLSWIGQQAAPLLASFSAWASSLVQWIPGAVVDFLGKWPGMLSQFLDWIGGAAGPLLLKLGEWALQFIAWIVPMIPGFIAALAGISVALLAFVGETVLTLTTKLLEWAGAFLGWIGTEVVPKIPGALAAVATAITDWIGGAVDTIKTEAAKIGDSLVKGAGAGVDTALAWMKGKLEGFANLLPGWVKDALGIHSPSRVFADEIGLPIAQGMAQGIDAGQRAVADSMQALVKQAIAALTGTSGDAKDAGKQVAAGVQDGVQAAQSAPAMPTSTDTSAPTQTGQDTAHAVTDGWVQALSADQPQWAQVLQTVLQLLTDQTIRPWIEGQTVVLRDGGAHIINALAAGINGAAGAVTAALQKLGNDMAAAITRGFGTPTLTVNIVGKSSNLTGGGGVPRDLFGGARALGGPVAAGVPYLVGERGREVVVPQQSGYVVPNTMVRMLASVADLAQRGTAAPAIAPAYAAPVAGPTYTSVTIYVQNDQNEILEALRASGIR